MSAFYNTKGWYLSKTIWAGIVTAVIGVVALFTPNAPDATQITNVIDIVITAAGLLGVYGRVTATTAIGTPATA